MCDEFSSNYLQSMLGTQTQALSELAYPVQGGTVTTPSNCLGHSWRQHDCPWENVNFTRWKCWFWIKKWTSRKEIFSTKMRNREMRRLDTDKSPFLGRLEDRTSEWEHLEIRYLWPAHGERSKLRSLKTLAIIITSLPFLVHDYLPSNTLSIFGFPCRLTSREMSVCLVKVKVADTPKSNTNESCPRLLPARELGL